MSKSILCTPVGLQTPKGIARVNKAVEALNDRNADVASVASDLVAKYEMNGSDIDWPDQIIDLAEAVKHRDVTYQEMLRAVAGYPSAAAEGEAA